MSPSAAASILIIDDNANIRKMAQRRLEREGYRVLLAEDGQTGLALAISESPNLIVLDLMMPVMPGQEVLRRLKEDPATRAIPVIVLTVVGPQDEAAAPAKLGYLFHIMKPYDSDDLLDKIRMALSAG